MKPKTLLLYHHDLQPYGGITTFTKAFIQRMSKYYNITFVYERGDTKVLEYLTQYCKVEQVRPQSHWDADIFLIASSWGAPIFNQVTTGTVLCVIHANLESYALLDIFKMIPDKRIDYFISVSKDVQGAFKRLHNLDSIVIHNMLPND